MTSPPATVLRARQVAPWMPSWTNRTPPLPKGALTPRRKAGDRRVSRRRIVVEHGIGKMKVWRVAAERWRNPRRRHTLMMKNVAGLHNRMFAA